MKIDLSKPLIILMSHIKLGDFLMLTAHLRALQAQFPLITIVVPDLLYDLYKEQNIFSKFISSNGVDKFVDYGENSEQILNLSFPLIDNISIPNEHFRLDKKYFLHARHIFYSYQEALENLFENCLSYNKQSTSYFAEAKPFLEINPDQNTLSKYGVNIFNYFTIHSGSDFAPKNWDPLNFEKTVTQILKIYPKLKCLSLVGPQDEELFKTSKPARFQTVKTSLRDVAHLISGSVFHLDNDSGIHHLAGAMNVPSITVFGPTGPGTWASLTPSNFIHWGGLQCADHCGGARMAECQNRVCLTSVKVDSVVNSAKDILAHYNHIS